MGKKRAREADGSTGPSNKMAVDNESSDDEDFDMVNVEFEWFNFDADVDFHGTKSLLRQLLDVVSTLFDVSALADLILSQPTIGSTVKVDGKATDAYALMTALNPREHREKRGPLARYLAEKAQQSGDAALASTVPDLLLPAVSDEQPPKTCVGLVISERLINMPSEIAPPMYRMLTEEIADAVEDGEPYRFTHYLILSKTYREIESKLDNDGADGAGDAGERRKSKKGKMDPAPAVFPFHPEDEVLQRHALAHGSYPFTKHDEAAADSKRAFQELGIAPQGHMILIEAAKFEGAVKAVGEYLSPPS